jgi:SAM-dependent methyltransferase
MSYDGLAAAASAKDPHLGGNIKAGDPFTYSPSVWNYVIDRFCIGTALDIGSGSGHASYYLHSKGVKVVAVEGFRENVENSLYPAVLHDLTQGPIVTRVDLVHCQEVVEHIEELYLDNLLDSFKCGKFLLMTHALPGQGGYHHVNCQPPSYWIDHLATRHFRLMVEDTKRVKELASRDGAKFLTGTGMIFVNNARL